MGQPDLNLDKEDAYINMLITELESDRNDARNSDNQIMQTIGVAATLLGVFTGTSMFANPNIDEMKVYQQVIFLLSATVFIAVVSYIVTLGIKNVLRYYHIQDIENRLYKFFDFDKQNSDRNLIHWDSLCAPVITRDPKHIASRYGISYFFSCSLAALSALAFCIIMLIFQFLRIPDKTQCDYVISSIMVFILTVLGMTFGFSAFNVNKRIKNLRKAAQQNIESRLTGNPSAAHKTAMETRKMVRYFIYPKMSDLQKPLLIVLGFVGGICLSGFEVLSFELCFHLLYAMFVFDFLAYQARYFINDIRGINDGNDRLHHEDKQKEKRNIQVALIDSFVRIIAAIILTITAPKTVRIYLVIALVLLVFSTISYEWARSTKKIILVYFLVGMGYPLRFFLGLIIVPIMHVPILVLCYLSLGVALWAYGSCASILSWANEVTKKTNNMWNIEKPDYTKEHFKDLHTKLAKRFNSDEKNKGSEYTPLKKQGKLADPWNVAYMTMLCGFLISFSILETALECGAGLMMIGLEIITFLLLLQPARVFRWGVTVGVGVVISLVIGVVGFVLGGSLWYLFMRLLQIMCVLTYLFLRENRPIDLSPFLKIYNRIGMEILGNDAWEVLHTKDSSENQ